MGSLIDALGIHAFDLETVMYICYLIVGFSVSGYIAAAIVPKYSFMYKLVVFGIIAVGYIPARFAVDFWFVDPPMWLHHVQGLIKNIIRYPVTIAAKPTHDVGSTVIIAGIAMTIASTYRLIKQLYVRSRGWVELDIRGQHVDEYYKDPDYEHKLVKMANNYFGLSIKIHRFGLTRYIHYKDAEFLRMLWWELDKS